MGTITMHVCADRLGGIGKDDHMAWEVPLEMKNFLEATENTTILVTSFTYRGLPESFVSKHRIIVYTRNPDEYVDDIYKGRIDNAISDIHDIYRYVADRDISVCGGTQLYKDAIDYVDRIVISRLYEEYDCTHFLPDIDFDAFNEVESKVHSCEKSNVKFSTTLYERF